MSDQARVKAHAAPKYRDLKRGARRKRQNSPLESRARVPIYINMKEFAPGLPPNRLSFAWTASEPGFALARGNKTQESRASFPGEIRAAGDAIGQTGYGRAARALGWAVHRPSGGVAVASEQVGNQPIVHAGFELEIGTGPRHTTVFGKDAPNLQNRSRRLVPCPEMAANGA